jgi:hypothetical protein
MSLFSLQSPDSLASFSVPLAGRYGVEEDLPRIYDIAWKGKEMHKIMTVPYSLFSVSSIQWFLLHLPPRFLDQ